MSKRYQQVSKTLTWPKWTKLGRPRSRRVTFILVEITKEPISSDSGILSHFQVWYSMDVYQRVLLFDSGTGG